MTTPATTPEATVSTYPGAPDRRRLIIDNVIALVLAAMIMVRLHEAAHWLTAAGMGDHSVLYPYGVDQNGSSQHAVITAAAGPVFSLVSGALFYLWQPFRKHGGMAHLVWVWLAMTSLQEGITYLCLTPLAGDTQTIASILELPMWLQLLAVVVGVAGMFGNAWLFAPIVREIAGPDIHHIRAMTIWTWAIGSVILMVASLVQLAISTMQVDAASQVAVVANGMAVGVFAPMAIDRAAKLDRPLLPMRLPKVPVGSLVFIVALIALDLLTRNGIPLN